MIFSNLQKQSQLPWQCDPRLEICKVSKYTQCFLVGGVLAIESFITLQIQLF
jgi:hypothetical protein